MDNFVPPEQFYPQVPRKYSSSGLLVPYNGKYIILRKSYGDKKLTIPGGVSELGESIAATAIREAKEEIGLDLEIEKFGNVTYQKADEEIKGKGDAYHFIFLAKPINDEMFAKIKLDGDEIESVECLSRDEIFKLRDEIKSTFLKRVCFAINEILYAEL